MEKFVSKVIGAASKKKVSQRLAGWLKSSNATKIYNPLDESQRSVD